MAEFTASVYQNEYLPDGGTDVNAIVTVVCSGAGTAGGRPAAGRAGEVIIVDTSGSMGPSTMAAARQAAQAAVNEILDGTWFAVIAGSDRAMLAFPAVSSGPGMVQMSSADPRPGAGGRRALRRQRRHRHLAPGSTSPASSSARCRR